MFYNLFLYFENIFMKIFQLRNLLLLSSLYFINGCVVSENPINFFPMVTNDTDLKQINVENETQPAPIISATRPNLLNTKWKYSDDDGSYQIEFANDGVLKKFKANKPTGKHRWIQEGTNIEFYFNNKASFYRGKFSGQNLITGTATSKYTKESWNWKALRLDY